MCVYSKSIFTQDTVHLESVVTEGKIVVLEIQGP